MKSIPRALLIHKATLRSPAGCDMWQQQEYGPEVNLQQVRIDPGSKLVLSKDNRELQLSAVMLFDCRRSRPEGITFTEGQQVTFCGQDYIVVTVDPLYDERQLHHWEVGLA